MTIVYKEIVCTPSLIRKDMKQRMPNGLKSAIATTRIDAKKDVHITRTSIQRYAELPSLRYGSTPTPTAIQMLSSGPLRVSPNQCCKEAVVSRSIQRSKSFTADRGVSCNEKRAFSQEAPPTVRRVHFAELPPKESIEADMGEGPTGDGTSTAEKRTKTRAGAEVGCSVPNNPRPERRHLASSVSFPPQPGPHVLRLGNQGGTQSGTVLPNRHASFGHVTHRYHHGTLTEVLVTPPVPSLPSLLQAARDDAETDLNEVLRKATRVGISVEDLNATDRSGRTALSYIASNGDLNPLEAILRLPGIDVNKPDNEGNTPLHFAAQAGQVEVISCMLSTYSELDVDARNSLGFTPLMKAALQGRSKCAKLLLCAGASPMLRDAGRGLTAEQWARYCGRYSCADVIEKFSKQSGRNGDHSRWGSEPELAARILGGKLGLSHAHYSTSSISLKSRIRKAFRTNSHPGHTSITKPFSIVSHLTSAALCAGGPLMPSNQTSTTAVKSLVRPLVVPKVQVILATSNGDDGAGNSQAFEQSAKERHMSIRLVSTPRKKQQKHTSI